MNDVLAGLREAEARLAAIPPPARSSYRVTPGMRTMIFGLLAIMALMVVVMVWRSRSPWPIILLAPVAFFAAWNPRLELDDRELRITRRFRADERFPLADLRFRAWPLSLRLTAGRVLWLEHFEPPGLYADLVRRGVGWPERTAFTPTRGLRVVAGAAIVLWFLAGLGIFLAMLHPDVPRLFTPAGIGLLGLLLLGGLLTALPTLFALTGRAQLHDDRVEVSFLGRTTTLHYRELRVLRGFFAFSLVTPGHAALVLPGPLGEDFLSALYQRWKRAPGAPYR